MSRYARFLPDRFTLFLVITVLIASVLPARGASMVAFSWITNLGIALLFFLHGARLPREAIVAGFTHWRLHLTIFAATFIMFQIGRANVRTPVTKATLECRFLLEKK